jgi:hypothetical protein
MMLGVLRLNAVASVILNDIGPVIEPQGLLRIKSFVGKLPIVRNFEEGAQILRWLFERNSGSSHGTTGSRLPSALGERAAARLCPTTISSSPDLCGQSIWSVSRRFGTNSTHWQAYRSWSSVAGIPICWP